MIDAERLKRLKELLSDAESCARLTQWEEEFCDDMRTRALTQGIAMNLSDAQERVLSRIEEKVYA